MLEWHSPALLLYIYISWVLRYEERVTNRRYVPRSWVQINFSTSDGHIPLLCQEPKILDCSALRHRFTKTLRLAQTLYWRQFAINCQKKAGLQYCTWYCCECCCPEEGQVLCRRRALLNKEILYLSKFTKNAKRRHYHNSSQTLNRPLIPKQK